MCNETGTQAVESYKHKHDNVWMCVGVLFAVVMWCVAGLLQDWQAPEGMKNQLRSNIWKYINQRAGEGRGGTIDLLIWAVLNMMEKLRTVDMWTDGCNEKRRACGVLALMLTLLCAAHGCQRAISEGCFPANTVDKPFKNRWCAIVWYSLQSVVLIGPEVGNTTCGFTKSNLVGRRVVFWEMFSVCEGKVVQRLECIETETRPRLWGVETSQDRIKTKTRPVRVRTTISKLHKCMSNLRITLEHKMCGSTQYTHSKGIMATEVLK